jgi:putative endopeptidase
MNAAATALAAACLLAFAGAASAAGEPMYGNDGFDATALDPATRPGDDFFRYVNGSWLDRQTIPADETGVTRRIEMSDRIEARLHELMTASASGNLHELPDLEGKVGAYYQAFMDEERIERLQAQPIEAELAAVRASKSRSALAAAMGRNNLDFEATLFGIDTDVDLKDVQHYAVYLSQDGLGLPDRDYYLQSQFSQQKAAYRAYVGQLLKLLHWRQADQCANDVVSFETRIAKVSWSKAQDRDVNATYNPMSIAQLQQLAPGFGWRQFLAAAGLADTERVIVAEITAFPKLAAVFAQTPMQTLQAWQAFHIADNAAPYLSRSFAAAWFELHQKVLSGQTQQAERWKRAITAVSGDAFAEPDNRFGAFATMGWAVGQLYSAKYFPAEAKSNIEALARNLIASYRARLEQLDWMSPATKAEALNKLETYTIKLGYPVHPRVYSGLTITDDDLVSDVRRVAADNWRFKVQRLAGSVDRDAWSMTPQTNNAYNGELRDIVFPAGILQPPVFDVDADPAINYGAVGGIIGHELTHGFDDQGRKIDAAGALRDWWRPEDATAFQARAEKLNKQYSAFHPLAGDDITHVNGELTLGENIADLGGLSLALDAYHASLHGQAAPVIDGFTGDQRVFMGWAQAWCGKMTDDFVRKQVVSDPHSPRALRVNGVVRNMDAWYAAFAVNAGDRLYLPPEERVRIW